MHAARCNHEFIGVGKMNLPPHHRTFCRSPRLSLLTRQILADDVAQCLWIHAGDLCSRGQPQQAMWLYTEVLKVLPKAGAIWHAYGVLRHQLGQQRGALSCFQHALQLPGPHAAEARDSLENLKSFVVDRWHFRMLNDLARNRAYDTAIRRAVLAATSELGRAPTVLDIGAGTGLLSIMSARAGAGHVYACEINDALCGIAAEAIKGAGYAGSITVLSTMSTSLAVGPEAGMLPGKVDMIVTELVDSGLLGEKIIPALRHAQEHLLAPRGVVLPLGCTVYGTLIESTELRRRSHFAAALDPQVGDSADVVFMVDEPYSCESLKTLPHKRLHAPVRLREIRFLDAPTDCPPTDVQLSIVRNGRVDAIAIWYDLHVDYDGGTTIGTQPERGESCGWDQGVYFLEPSICRHVAAGDVVRLSCWHDEDQLRFDLLQVGSPDSFAVVSTRGSTFTGASNPALLDKGVFRVGEMDMAMLNDHRRHDIFTEGLQRLIRPGDNVLCLARNWCPLPVRLWKSLDCGRLVVHVDDPESADALREIGRRQGIDQAGEGAAIIILGGEWPLAVQNYCDHMGCVDSSDTTSPLLVITDVVEGCGLLRQNVAQEVGLVLHSCLQRPRIAPERLTIRACLIDCPFLRRQNEVDPAATMGIDVSGLDTFGVTCFRELHLNNMDARYISVSFVAMEFTLEQLAVEDRRLIFTQRVHVTGAGPVSAVAFWFCMHMDTDTVIHTGPSFDGGHEESHWRQAAYLLQPPQHLDEGSYADVTCTLHRNSRIAFEVRMSGA